MATLGSSAAGEGPDGLDGGSIRLARLQMTEAGIITAIENYIATYGAPTDYYALIYRGDSSGPTTLAYSSSLITAAPSNAVASHTLSSSISASSGEYLWAGVLCIAGGTSYTTVSGKAIAVKNTSGVVEDPLTGEVFYHGYTYSVALTYTPSGGSPTVDSYPATVRSGSTGNAYTTTGLSSVTAISIGTLAATSISDTTGDGTHSVPALVDGVAHELYGTKTVTVTGTEGSPTTTTSFQPATGNSFVTLAGTLNTTDTGGLFNFSPAAVVTDQIVFPTVGIAYDAQGNITGEAGSYSCWHIQASTKTARSYTVTLGSVWELDAVGEPNADPYTLPSGWSKKGSGTGRFSVSSETFVNGNSSQIVAVYKDATAGEDIYGIRFVVAADSGSVDRRIVALFANETTGAGHAVMLETEDSASPMARLRFMGVSGFDDLPSGGGTEPLTYVTGDTFEALYDTALGEITLKKNGTIVSSAVVGAIAAPVQVGLRLQYAGTISKATTFFETFTEVSPVMPADASVDVNVGATTLGTFAATSGTAPITYSLSGTDAALFSVNPSTGAVTFVAPATVGVYTVIVTATNGAGADSQTLTVTVSIITPPSSPPSIDKRFIMEFIAANAKASKPLGYQQLTNLATATGLTVPAGTVYVLFKPNAQAIRFRDDGTNPTASVGYPQAAGAEYIYTGCAPSSLRFIEVTAGATLDVLYYGVV